jgi:hypothetical protein
VLNFDKETRQITSVDCKTDTNFQLKQVKKRKKGKMNDSDTANDDSFA